MSYLAELSQVFKKKKEQGITVPGNFWPFDQVKFATKKKEDSQPAALPPEPKAPKPAEPNIDTGSLVSQFCLENPNASPVAFVQWLKTKGYSIVGGPAKEADSGSTHVAVLRKQEAIKFVTRGRFKESSGANKPSGYTTFKTVLIEEGMGNLNDAFYYTRQALEGAIAVFEGKKIYADHPSLDEEQLRPERSVRDVLGYFSGVTLEEGDQGQAMLVGECNILPDPSFEWARALMREAFEYSKKYPGQDLIGLSINAQGSADEMKLDDFMKAYKVPESAMPKIDEARAQGLNSIRVVNKLGSAISCDLVTEAGAKGRVIQPLK